jgi:hypothetical protein
MFTVRLRPPGYGDHKIAGFLVRVGLNTKTYRLQMDVRESGRRVTRSFSLGKHPHTGADDARAKALDIIRRRAPFAFRPQSGKLG